MPHRPPRRLLLSCGGRKEGRLAHHRPGLLRVRRAATRRRVRAARRRAEACPLLRLRRCAGAPARVRRRVQAAANAGDKRRPLGGLRAPNPIARRCLTRPTPAPGHRFRYVCGQLRWPTPPPSTAEVSTRAITPIALREARRVGERPDAVARPHPVLPPDVQGDPRHPLAGAPRRRDRRRDRRPVVVLAGLVHRQRIRVEPVVARGLGERVPEGPWCTPAAARAAGRSPAPGAPTTVYRRAAMAARSTHVP